MPPAHHAVPAVGVTWSRNNGGGRRALFLQPFYRIDRLAVDPQLKIEGAGAGRRPAHRAQDGLVIDMGAALNRQGRKIAVQRLRLTSVIGDYQITEARERVGERHLTLVDGFHEAALSRRDFDAVSDDGRAEPSPLLAAER